MTPQAPSAQVGSRGFLQWASARVSGVQELEVAWTGQKGVAQKDMFAGLSLLLARMPSLQQLAVPHHFSLPPAILSCLPPSLVEAHLCVAFNEGCLVDAGDADVPAYAFPEGMPHLKTLVMQASPLAPPLCICQISLHGQNTCNAGGASHAHRLTSVC